MYAYIDCSSGISGDMFLGALLDAGAPVEEIERAVRALKLRGIKIVVNREKRSAIWGRRVIVEVPRRSKDRDWRTIREMIRKASGLSPGTRKRAIKIFEEIAKAEARIHNQPVSRVHFHEIGALDSIVDIVGASAALEFLGVNEMGCSPVPLGSGKINSRHGVLPLPAPATVELLEGLTAYGAGIEGELTTPTGAAILRSLVSECGPMPPLRIKKTGYGVGSRSLPDRPNVLRIILGERAGEFMRDRAIILEANVDDMPPQDFEPLMDSLFEAGALDVLFIPVQMKKNRPGVLVQALAPEGKAGRVTLALFRHSSTLGVRSHPVNRRILKRIVHVAQTTFGDIHYKKVQLPAGAVRITPEYEDLKSAAKRAGVSMEKMRRSFWATVKEE